MATLIAFSLHQISSSMDCPGVTINSYHFYMYILNNFKRKRSTAIILYKNFIYLIKWGVRILVTGKKVKTVLLYPQYPGRKAVIYKILTSLGWNITNNPNKKHHLVVYWHDTTYRNPDATIIYYSKEELVVNLKCTDISKSNVDKVFSEVFGYSSIVQPESFTGKMVKKNEINASHDGVIVQGPLTPEEGFIYQKVINNEYDSNFVVDMRIPVINGKMVLGYLKFKSIKSRFANFSKNMLNFKEPEVYPIENLLSAEEISLIANFCQRIGLDYGELDVLRDNDDKKIYIIDVNNTPTGPTINKSLKSKSIKKLANLFKAEFLPN